jgi:hypothetical protein
MYLLNIMRYTIILDYNILYIFRLNDVYYVLLSDKPILRPPFFFFFFYCNINFLEDFLIIEKGKKYQIKITKFIFKR